MCEAPQPFAIFGDGETFLHGTKAVLEEGDLLVPGRGSNFEAGRVSNHIYFAKTLDAAAWGAELAAGDGRPRVYVVEPTGAFHDDPNVTDKRFPGNPTMSYRSTEPVRVVRELGDWVGHSEERIQEMRDGLAELERSGRNVIED
jgi:rifampin ADP-ribosylating transferase